jgi:hypothetical protein
MDAGAKPSPFFQLPELGDHRRDVVDADTLRGSMPPPCSSVRYTIAIEGPNSPRGS